MAGQASCDLCGLKPEPVWRDDKLSVIMADDPAHPGFCRVVWNGHVREMSDLAAGDRLALNDAVWHVELALRAVMAPDKVNLASLGNMTPHLHWHVIARFADDAQFPHPVWSAAVRQTAQPVLAARRSLLPRLKTEIVRRMSGK